MQKRATVTSSGYARLNGVQLQIPQTNTFLVNTLASGHLQGKHRSEFCDTFASLSLSTLVLVHQADPQEHR